MSIRVGLAFAKAKRYKEDNVYREKRKDMGWRYRKKNKAKIQKYLKKYNQELSEFRNKRCNNCNKLLSHKTQGNYCRNHFKMKNAS